MRNEPPEGLILGAQNDTLRVRLDEAQELLRAIQSCEVDALVIDSGTGPRVFTLQGVDAASNRFRGEILAQVSDAVIAIDDDHRVTYLNAAAERQYDIDLGAVLGQSLSKVYQTRWLQPGDETVAAIALREGGAWRGENVHVKTNGRELQVESSVTVLRAVAGEPAGLLAVVRDISDRKRTQEAVRISEIRYRRLFEAAQDGVLLLDPRTRKITDANPFMTRLLGYSHEQLVGKELFEIGLLEDEDASREMLRKLKDMHQVRYEDLPLQSQGGQHKEVEVVANLYDENGSAVIQCNIRDITERKRVEEHNKLLMAEVNHRAMNLLAVVQAVAQQTARGDPVTFVERLTERIEGLAASQDLLVRNEWRGVGVLELIEAQLAHFKDLIGTRVLLDGGPAQLTPAAAQGIGMALHELATNAGKYGALSNGEGRVRISWQVAAAEPKSLFLMSWSEEGGPSVAPPTRKGFGQMVIGRMVEKAVSGMTTVEYRESGFSWKLSAPVSEALEPVRLTRSTWGANV